MTVDNPDWAGL